jgi:hypothetical protein
MLGGDEDVDIAEGAQRRLRIKPASERCTLYDGCGKVGGPESGDDLVGVMRQQQTLASMIRHFQTGIVERVAPSACSEIVLITHLTLDCPYGGGQHAVKLRHPEYFREVFDV